MMRLIKVVILGFATVSFVWLGIVSLVKQPGLSLVCLVFLIWMLEHYFKTAAIHRDSHTLRVPNEPEISPCFTFVTPRRVANIPRYVLRESFD